MEQQKIMTRQEQRTEDTWNMQGLYETEEQFGKDGEKLEKMMEKFASYQGSLGEGAGQLLKVLKLYEEMNLLFERMYVYANQKYHEDTANARYQQMSGEMQIMATQLGQAAAWLEPEILSLPEEVLDGYWKKDEDKKETESANAGNTKADDSGEERSLSDYKWFLEQITRRRAHVLDAKTEALLSKVNELGQAPSNIFSMFNNADIRFPEIEDGKGSRRELTQGTYISCLESRDRVLRKNAFEALYSVYGQFQNTLAATYYANMKQADFFAKERHYGNAMEESLDGSSIPVEVYKNLIKAVNAALPVMHRYVRLRKKLLGLDELHMYDVHVPMVERPEKNYTFEEAKEIVKRGLAPLGEDYLALLQEGFDNRWIDVYENTGKRTGAYSWGAYGTHPYVLLNFHGSLNDVFTLAHEMGHALHSWHSDHAQPYLYAGYRIFVAEVASTCNEALLIHDLMNRTEDEKEKRYLINYFLDKFKGTMFRQTMFAEFEMITHGVVERGGMMTAEQINETYLNLNKKYYGTDMVSDPEIALEWARIPHFYTPFYVYQYATGFAAAIAISSRILSGEPGIVEKYKKFLSGGSSMDPIDLLKLCDVDMSSTKPVTEALAVFEEYLGKLEQSVVS
ncbi:MAG: oligoendopeptidase F [Eubacteriales bacterium]|nr:oligoendopeptidase F [Eubacteriales bacterium]